MVVSFRRRSDGPNCDAWLVPRRASSVHSGAFNGAWVRKQHERDVSKPRGGAGEARSAASTGLRSVDWRRADRIVVRDISRTVQFANPRRQHHHVQVAAPDNRLCSKIGKYRILARAGKKAYRTK